MVSALSSHRVLPVMLVVLGLALACEQPKLAFDFEVESCIDGAESVQFDFSTNGCVVTPVIQEVSNNVVSVDIQPAGPDHFVVTAELGHIALHETVDFTFECAGAALGTQELNATVFNIAFYPTPAPGPESPCPMSGTPTFAVRDEPGCGPLLELSNQHNPAPVYVPSVQIAEAPAALPSGDLHWGAPDLEALDWCRVFTHEFVLINPFDNVFTVCLNSARAECSGGNALSDGPPPGAVFVRFVSYYSGLRHRGIIQVDLASGTTVTVEESTWGKVKALYRN
jgi:hypothetical protein